MEDRYPEEPSRPADDFALARNKSLSQTTYIWQLFVAIAKPNLSWLTHNPKEQYKCPIRGEW